MTSPTETLSSLREIAAMARALYHGVKKAQTELRQSDIEVPETLKRTLHRLDMDLDDFAFDLDQMTK